MTATIAAETYTLKVVIFARIQMFGLIVRSPNIALFGVVVTPPGNFNDK